MIADNSDHFSFVASVPTRRLKKRTIRRLWRASCAAVAGQKHVQRGLPCQDAVFAGIEPLPYVVVCDGKGSASLSHLGALGAVEDFADYVLEHQCWLQQLLGSGSWRESGKRKAWDTHVREVLMRRLQDSMWKLSREHGKPTSEFEFTISAAVMGRCHMGWLHLGDSGITIVKRGTPQQLCAPHKGHYTNETMFVNVGTVATRQVDTGLITQRGLDAVVAYSDGAGIGFLNHPGQRSENPFIRLAKALPRRLPGQDILGQVLNHSSWQRVSDDDRSLGVLSRI